MTSNAESGATLSKRPAEDDEERSAKRQRPDPQTTLTALPTEVQATILGEVLREHRDQPERSLPAVRRLGQVNRKFRDLVYHNREDAKAHELIPRIDRGKALADRIPVAVPPPGTLGGHKIGDLVIRSETIALHPVDERGAIVGKVLKMRAGDDKTDALHGLVGNLGHLEADDRRAIVEHVCEAQHEDGGMERLLKAIVQQSDHLQASELESVAHAALASEEPEAQRDCLDAFAGRMSRLGHDTQAELLRHVCQDGDRTAQSLGAFSAKLDDIAPEHRAGVVDAVLALPADRPGRMWAMSGLAAHLDALDEGNDRSDRPNARRVAADILGKADHPERERADDDLPWHAQPSLCAVEAVHHLARHRGLLDQQPERQTHDFIRRVLDARTPDLAQQAQLLPHMDESQRTGFVAGALEEATELGADGHDVVASLTLRVKDLRDDEKTAYVDHVHHADSAGSALLDDVLNYNMKTQLHHFPQEEQTHLVNERLAAVKAFDPDTAAETFGPVAGNAATLKFSNIQKMLTTAKTKGRDIKEHDEEEGTTVSRDMAAMSTRALADWSKHQLAATIDRLTGSPTGARAAPRPRAANLDDRARDRSPSR